MSGVRVRHVGKLPEAETPLPEPQPARPDKAVDGCACRVDGSKSPSAGDQRRAKIDQYFGARTLIGLRDANHETRFRGGLPPRRIAQRTKVADERDEHGQARLAAIDPGTATIGEVSAAQAGLDTVEPMSFAGIGPGVAGREYRAFRDGKPGIGLAGSWHGRPRRGRPRS